MYRDGAGATKTQELRDKLAIVKTQLLDATAQRNSFQMRVMPMRANALTTELRDQHQRTRDHVSELTVQLTAAQVCIRQLEADLVSANVALGWDQPKK